MQQTKEINPLSAFISTDKLEAFQSKMLEIQAIAKKLELPEWEVSIGTKEWRLIDSVYGVEGSVVTISGQAMTIRGFEFIAKIDHDKNGNVVKPLVKDLDSPKPWHSIEPSCAHCNEKRNRRFTFMLENIESHEIIQVGSTCLNDFVADPSRSPESILDAFDALTLLMNSFEFNFKKPRGKAHWGVSPIVFLSHAMVIIAREGGFLSFANAKDMGASSTGKQLISLFWGKREIDFKPSTAQIQKAQKIIESVRGKGNHSNLYIRNLSNLADRDYIDSENAGLFASAYYAWSGMIEQSFVEKHSASSAFGVVKQSYTEKLTLLSHSI